MKKLTLSVVIAIGLLALVVAFTPVGRAFLDLGFFVVEAGRYMSKERALAEEIHGWPSSKFEELVRTCARLANARNPKDKSAPFSTELLEGVPTPAELAHLKPQRVWIEHDSVEIELMHMMDSDVTLTVAKGKDGGWTVTGHFGDYMNKPELLFPKREESNQALRTTPVSDVTEPKR